MGQITLYLPASSPETSDHGPCYRREQGDLRSDLVCNETLLP